LLVALLLLWVLASQLSNKVYGGVAMVSSTTFIIDIDESTKASGLTGEF
jgi:hypothetical protein